MGGKCSCSARDLLFSYPNARHLADPQWPANVGIAGSIVFAIYRSIVAIFLLVFMIRSLVREKGFYFIYLTEWAFTLLTVYFVLASVSSIIYSVKRIRGVDVDGVTTWYFRFHWLMFELAASPAIVVTILFWALLFPTGTSSAGLDSVVQHAINSVLLLLDLFVSATPARALHFIYPTIFGICYAIFAVIYWKAGGQNINGEDYIYSVLDFSNDPSSAVQWVFIAIIATGVVHFLVWGFYKLRLYIFTKTSEQEPENMELKGQHRSTVEPV